MEVLVRLPGERNLAAVGELLDLVFDPQTTAWELDREGGWRHVRGERDLQSSLVEQQRRRRTPEHAARSTS
ncbi:MAG: hypothetical protein R2734_14415 [Nocardioides sp.]